MEDDAEPRRLPPQPTITQSGIRKPAVPEVTLLWEGEDSVYWTPNQPTTTQQLQQHQQMSLAAPNKVSDAGSDGRGSVAANIRSGRDGNNNGICSRVVNVAGTTGAPVYGGNSVGVAAIAGALRSPARRSVVAQVRRSVGLAASVTNNVSSSSNATTRVNALRTTGPLPTLTASEMNHTPFLPVAATARKSLVAGILHQNRSSESSNSIGFVSNLERQNIGVGQHDYTNIAGSRAESINISRNLPVGVNDKIQNFQSQAVKTMPQNQPVLHNTQQHQATMVKSSVVDSTGKILKTSSSNENLNAALYRNQEYNNDTSPDADRQQGLQYNPGVYNSAKKLPRRTLTNNGSGASLDHTPVLSKHPKNIVPRAVDFHDVTPINVHGRQISNNNKENVSPDILGESRGVTASDGSPASAVTLHSQMVQYNRYHLDSAQMQQVASPDPFLCRIIEGKDKQIFQLHKVLETVLNKSDCKEQSSSNNSSEIHCSKSSSQKVACTQTSFCDDTKPDMRTIGVNTDFTWSDIMKSLQGWKNFGSELNSRANSSPATILKNSITHKSSIVMQNNCNTSSVRFETCLQNLASKEYVTEIGNEQPRQFENSDKKNKPRCSCSDNSRPMDNRNNNNTRNISHPINDAMTLGEKKHLMHVNRNNGDHRGDYCDPHSDRDANNKHDASENFNTGNERTDPASLVVGGGFNGGHVAGGGNHREVSLTLREVVLTTIHKDPASPQQSRQLNLPEHQNDTIIQQQQHKQDCNYRHGSDSCGSATLPHNSAGDGVRGSKQPAVIMRRNDEDDRRNCTRTQPDSEPNVNYNTNSNNGCNQHNQMTRRNHTNLEGDCNKRSKQYNENTRNNNYVSESARGEYYGERKGSTDRPNADRPATPYYRRPSRQELGSDAPNYCNDGGQRYSAQNIQQQGYGDQHQGYGRQQYQYGWQQQDDGRQQQYSGQLPDNAHGGSGVTIFRNLMNNIGKILQDPQEDGQSHEQQRRPDHQREDGGVCNKAGGGGNDAQMMAIQQQLQLFGLSFIEPHALAHQHRLGGPQSSSAGRGEVRDALQQEQAPQSGRSKQTTVPNSVESLLSLYRANAIAAAAPQQQGTSPDTAATGEFSIATAEFLRKNGVLNAE